MKVVGTGSPLMLTVRVKTAEMRLWRDVLCDRRARVVLDAANAGTGSAKGGRRRVDLDVEVGHGELVLITKLLEALERPAAPGQPLELVGPTRLLDPVIRDIASEAAQRLSEAIDVFRSDRDQLSADELRGAVETACASAATLIGLDHVQNHAVELGRVDYSA